MEVHNSNLNYLINNINKSVFLCTLIIREREREIGKHTGERGSEGE